MPLANRLLRRLLRIRLSNDSVAVTVAVAVAAAVAPAEAVAVAALAHFPLLDPVAAADVAMPLDQVSP